MYNDMLRTFFLQSYVCDINDPYKTGKYFALADHLQKQINYKFIILFVNLDLDRSWFPNQVFHPLCICLFAKASDSNGRVSLS